VQLERLYQENRTTFKREFNLIYPEIRETATAQIWNARLNFENERISWGTSKELIVVILLSFVAGLIAKIPDFTEITPDYFYPRNIAFVVFPLLAAYFAWKNKNQTKNMLIASVVFLVSVIYINLLPDDPNSDTLILACIHLPLFLWTVLGFTFVDDKLNNNQRRLDYLRYNADLVVMTTIILIAGALLTGITFGLFELIDIKIEEFYFHYIGIWGLAAAPIVGTYLVQTNPQLVNKVSPVIAKVFTPLVLVTLVVYLVALIFTGKDPYNDREFLLIFNALLIGVMAIIFFSIAETSKNADSKIGTILLLALSIVTVIVNGIALSAILFRISEWGITPNRLAVLGGNVLILINLLIVTYRLFKTIKDKNEIEKVENSIASFLPIYCLWTIFVTFIVPLLFNFK
ncbi:MAG TPA: hypothetical protein VFH08_10505, partial [Chitinophagaceae bacterium]|nr:hypothetical protein [Chitinophagaceae bacterium]